MHLLRVYFFLSLFVSWLNKNGFSQMKLWVFLHYFSCYGWNNSWTYMADQTFKIPVYASSLTLMAIFHQRVCSQNTVLSKVVFHQMVSSIKGQLQLKVVYHQKHSSKCSLTSKAISYWRVSSIYGHLLSKAFFHQKSYYAIKGCLQLKIVFHQK